MITDPALLHQTLFVGSQRLEEFKAHSPREQFSVDAAYWYGTCLNPGDRQKAKLLKRVWRILAEGGVWLRPEKAACWTAHSNSGIPLASILSHGGRVLVQLPRAGNLIWDWLWGDLDAQKFKRFAGTHGVETGSREILPNGRPKVFTETKKNKGGFHYGINIAGGGHGNTNPISGSTITDDGQHGHLYIHYQPASDTERGSIMFGAEDSAPIDAVRRSKAGHAVRGLYVTATLPITVLSLITGAGTKRQPMAFEPLAVAFPKGQTGAYHGFGVSGSYSLTGGQKNKKIDRTPAPDLNLGLLPKDKLDCVCVNPDVAKWQYIVSSDDFDLTALGRPPSSPPDYIEGLSFEGDLPNVDLLRRQLQGYDDPRAGYFLQICEEAQKDKSKTDQYALSFYNLARQVIDDPSTPGNIKRVLQQQNDFLGVLGFVL